jgi:hypothetical protein
MTLPGKIQLGLLLAAGILIGWELQQHAKRARELASVQAQVQAQQQELGSRRQALETLEQRHSEAQEAEQRAGNQTLLSLLRERNAATMATAQSAARVANASPGLGSALAKALDSPEHRQAGQESRRAEMRAGLYQFFKVLNLSPEKTEQYLDLCLDMEGRMTERLSALLHGTMTVAEAARQRASDATENAQRRQEVLGDEGVAFLNGIADGMQKDEAKRLAGIVQNNMGSNPLNQEQSDRLQALIKAEIIPINMDDIELFRPPQEWAQYCLECQQKVLSAATDFLTPAQLEILKAIGAADLANRQQRMADRRKALGIK